MIMAQLLVTNMANLVLSKGLLATSRKKKMKKENVQHQGFPGGHPPEY
jgi:hypothetical protein